MTQQTGQLKLDIVTNVLGTEKVGTLINQINVIPRVGPNIETLTGRVGALTGKLAVYGAAVYGVYKSVEQGLDFILEGEKVNAINAQFENLASTAGLSAEKLSEGLLAATSGLLDDEDALQVATRSIAAMGAEAARLPEVLTLAKSVSKSLGSDFQQTFDSLAGFLENGNAKALKQYGIILDLDAAYTKAAKSIGLTAGELNEVQKQQVRMDTLLSQAPQRFNSATDSVTPLKDAWTKLKVEISNTIEEYQAAAAEFTSKKFLDKSDMSNVGSTRLRNEFKETQKEVERLESEVKKLNATIVSTDPILSRVLEKKRTELFNARDKVQLQMVELSGRSDAELFAQLEASRNQPQTPKLELTAEQRELQAKKREEEGRKEAERLQRQRDQIERFNETQLGQIRLEQIRLENSTLAAAELEKLTMAEQLRTQAMRDSVSYSETNKQKMAEVTEEIIRQREELIDLQQAQRESFGEGARRSVTKWLESTRDMASQSERMFDRLFANMEDAIVDFALTGELSIKNMVDSIINEFIRMQARQAMYPFLNSIFGAGAVPNYSGYDFGSTVTPSLGSGPSLGGGISVTPFNKATFAGESQPTSGKSVNFTMIMQRDGLSTQVSGYSDPDDRLLENKVRAWFNQFVVENRRDGGLLARGRG